MVRITRARLEDINQITQVLRDTWIATYGSFLSAETIEKITSVGHDPNQLAIEIEDLQSYFGVATCQNDLVIGLVTVRLVEPEVVMIDRLYVHPYAQRQGIGEALLQASLTAFPNARRARLEVEARNSIGRAFWRKQGFKDEVEQLAYVGDEVLEVVVMVRTL